MRHCRQDANDAARSVRAVWQREGAATVRVAFPPIEFTVPSQGTPWVIRVVRSMMLVYNAARIQSHHHNVGLRYGLPGEGPGQPRLPLGTLAVKRRVSPLPYQSMVWLGQPVGYSSIRP